jgi:hypothetical protein
LSRRQKCLQIIARLKSMDGAPSQVTQSEIENDMDNLPPATDENSALTAITGLTLLNIILKKLGAGYSDAGLRTKLFHKLSAVEFRPAAEKINADPNMTFAQACEEIRNAINLSKMLGKKCDQQNTKKRPADDLDYAGSTSSVSAMSDSYFAAAIPFTNQRKQQRTIAQTAVTPAPASNNTVWQARAPGTNFQAEINAQMGPPQVAQPIKPVECWNCKGPHFHTQCTAPHCRRCQQFFTSVDDPRYHKMSNCTVGLQMSRPGNAGRGKGYGSRASNRGRGGRGYNQQQA